jgi:hypothetical protein
MDMSVVHRFNDTINRPDLPGLVELMTEPATRPLGARVVNAPARPAGGTPPS